MATSLSLQGITERAQSIRLSLTDKFEIDNAKQQAEQLYQEGIALATAEINGQPVISDIVSPVISELNNVVSMDKIQHQFSFHQTLSKAYRIFVELTWYQCWKKQSLLTFDTTRAMTISNSHQIISVLPKDQKMRIRFEYSCAAEAAKWLNPTTSIYEKYVTHMTTMVGSAVKLTPGEIIKELKGLYIDYKKDHLKEWYIDVFDLRWLSTKIKTPEDFKTLIFPKIEQFRRNGKNYTLCLATICFDLIKDPNSSSELRTLTTNVIISLLSLEDNDKITRFLKKLSKLIQQRTVKDIVKRIDRYWSTRSLIKESIEELWQQSSPDLKDCILSIAEKFTVIKPSSLPEDVKKYIEEKLQELADKQISLATFIQETEAYLSSVEGTNRDGEEDEIEQAKTDLQEAKTNHENLSNEIKILKSIAPALAELDQEMEEQVAQIKLMIGS